MGTRARPDPSWRHARTSVRSLLPSANATVLPFLWSRLTEERPGALLGLVRDISPEARPLGRLLPTPTDPRGRGFRVLPSCIMVLILRWSPLTDSYSLSDLRKSRAVFKGNRRCASYGRNAHSLANAASSRRPSHHFVERKQNQTHEKKCAHRSCTRGSNESSSMSSPSMPLSDVARLSPTDDLLTSSVVLRDSARSVPGPRDVRASRPGALEVLRPSSS